MKLQIKHIFLLFCFSMLLACNTIEKSQQIAESTLSKLKILPNTSDDFNFEKIQLLIDKKEYSKALKILNDFKKTNNEVALNFLGYLHLNGLGVKKNYKKAYEFFSRSQKLGNPWAYFNLGVMYQNGMGIDIDYKKAFSNFKFAADKNIIDAQHNMGTMYANGVGVSVSILEAIKYFKLAAINGKPISQRALGLSYEMAYGSDINYYEAKKWFVMAGQNGSPRAVDDLKRINQLIKTNPEIYSKNKIDAESIDLFTDVRTITIKRSKELFQSYSAIRETQIDSNYLTEGKVVIDNEICSSHAAYNSYVNRGVFHVICPSGYKASGLITPLGKNRGSRGEGKDSFGNKIQFNFHDKLQGQAKKEDMIALFERQKVIKIANIKKRGLANPNEIKRNLIKSHNFHALIIAIKDYKKLDNLKTPIKDGREIGKILQKKYGFNVDYLENATREDIIKRLNQLVKNLKKNDNLLIYYAGHGKMLADEGFWLPSDADNESDLNWVSNNDINRKLRQIKANNVLVVSDSCYSGALLKRGLNQDEKKMEASIESYLNTKSRVAITSGGLTPVLDGGGGGHSVFARVMINFLKNNSTPLTATRLYASTFEDVTNLSLKMKSEQTPQKGNLLLHGHEGPDFVLLPR